jgi:hypothetical protein
VRAAEIADVSGGQRTGRVVGDVEIDYFCLLFHISQFPFPGLFGG